MTSDERDVTRSVLDLSTLTFTRYFFKQLNFKRFVIGEHHQLISSALDKVINGEIKKLIINIAPRYGKTELAVKNFIAHGLAINPGSKFIHLSYSDDLALDNSEYTKEIVKHESYQQLFPNVQIKTSSDSKKKWYTTAGGGVYATGAAGQVTGFGAGQVDDIDDKYFAETGKNKTFGGALIIDDPIKPEDADSEVVRERINQRYDSTIKNRVNSRNTPIIIIMQRLHERDLCGYLQEQEPGEWAVLSLPCLIPEANGEPKRSLWPFKHTVEELEKLRSENEIVFDRQYQQDPQPLKGLVFPKEELKYFNPNEIKKIQGERPGELIEPWSSVIGYVDVADEGGDSLSFPIGKNIGTEIYITDWMFTKDNTDMTRPLVADLIKQHKVIYTRVESNNMGAQFGRDVQKLLENTPYTIRRINNDQNKHTRIIMSAPFVIKYCRFVHPDYQTEQYKRAMKELTSYSREIKGAVHDDAPDALSGLLVYIRQMLIEIY